MTTVDNNADGNPDGIINLYTEFNNLSGNSYNTSTGTWFDPDYNFAIDEATGNLYLWDLDNASEAINDYQFQLIDSNSSCPNGIIATVNVILGQFEGKPLPPQGPNDANVTICEATLSSFDLFQVFESQPSPHKNGVWAFVGNMGDPSNFKGLSQDGKFRAEIPYEPYGDLIEFDVFEFTYTVPGIAPCSPQKVSRFKVEVIRDVSAGTGSSFQICEADILSGVWDDDIDLRDDRFLQDEDVEGLWSSRTDPTGQISGPSDSSINIREVYDNLKASNPQFSCETFTYEYTVEARSSLFDCGDKVTSITFTFSEPIKAFSQNQALEVCADGTQPNQINLYDQLVFSTENGVLYDYPNSECTNWQLISGPSSLGLVSNTGSLCELSSADDHYTAMGTINTSNLTNADAGTYVFRYTVAPEYVCAESACSGYSANVTLIVQPNNYAGDDTIGLEFCETDPVVQSPLDLFSLLNTTADNGPIYKGDMGVWRDLNSGTVITNPVSLPNINHNQTFDYIYETTTENGCVDSAQLSFTVIESYQAGANNTIDVCSNNSPFSLLEALNGNPNQNGTWSGPNGFVSSDPNVVFDPSTFSGGAYTYTVPDNVNTAGVVMCSGSSATVTVTSYQSPNAGSSGVFNACKSDGVLNLVDYLDASADTGGTFNDLSATGFLTGNLLDVSQLSSGRYSFQYEIQGHASCNLSTALITLIVAEVEPPEVENQQFCASEGPTVNDLVATNGISFNWYDSVSSTEPLPLSTALQNEVDYFVSALDSNGCESSKVPVKVSILPVGHSQCAPCLKDGISPNGDGQNDVFDLCSLPVTYPNFSIEIINRYGSVVYRGNESTPLFNGKSNVPLTMGNQLPSGVYFYVFDPKDGQTKPFQGNFYLSSE
ncbi:gliding motility-associated C-terminal domain-containing protein [Tamlana crocina]